MGARGADIVHAARFDVARPHRKAGRVGEDLHVAALGLVLARIPPVMPVVVALVHPVDPDHKSVGPREASAKPARVTSRRSATLARNARQRAKRSTHPSIRSLVASLGKGYGRLRRISFPQLRHVETIVVPNSVSTVTRVVERGRGAACG